MNGWPGLIAGAAWDGLILCAEILAIVVPLLIGYELVKRYGVFERPWRGVGPALRRMGLSQGALVPLLAGLFLGILYGAGIMLALSREHGLDYRERLALGVFLATCHAVVEDTAIFVLLGGSAAGMLGPRLILAVAITLLLARRGARPAH